MDGGLRVARRVPERFRPLRVIGLELAGRPLEISVGDDGTPVVRAAAAGITTRRA